MREVVIAIALAMLSATPAVAKPEYTRKTAKACAYCHQPPGYNLNDAGKYYAAHGNSLKGYKAPKPKASHPSG
jgi:cytochrome c553